ncbi:L-alanine-DL-glutamate epimerase-like enolase superfamily enzyme [Pacificibacter maritimus]|uniref:L-alanine-DL-glutamate epimerase-like enolase superfamily enzyme n=1 Tax=Pacificibacter maritimus TaxID=762213 RepID=A0A3N4VAU2_9RHOB|nr:mandelate racemase/muconate lactonizing enzyme family protein [Pacificibacter maritimus]RPE70930.1 L-alanine-DL-glutamate epimerase-like enolase superfamily enzyme [Pacificibacter maritimus]
MKINAWSVMPVQHRNLDPEWHYAGRDVPNLQGVRVALSAGQVMGEGYAPFLPHLNTTPKELMAEARKIAAALLGAKTSDLAACLMRLGPCSQVSNAARSAVEMALLDLCARGADISVATLLGGTHRPVKVLRIIPVKSPACMAEIATSLVGEGYTALKLKATGEMEVDVARVAAVRAAVGFDVSLIVDANQAYDRVTAVGFEAALKSYKVWAIEQPVPADDPAVLAYLRHHATTRLEADEGLFHASDVDRLLSANAADGLCLKLARGGGILPARDMAITAANRNVYARIGTAFGGPLVAIATATLAAVCPVLGAAECAEFTHFDDEDHLWPVIENGVLMPPDGVGFGQYRLTPWAGDWHK